MFFLVMDNNLWTKKNHIKKFKGRSDGWFVDYSATLKLFLESVFKNKTNWVRRQLFNGEETFNSLWYPRLLVSVLLTIKFFSATRWPMDTDMLSSLILLTQDLQVYIGTCSIREPIVNALSLIKWLHI